MGRTIHYAVEKNDINKITEEQWRKIENLQAEYNSQNDWTCESLSLERSRIFPNWPAWESTGLQSSEVWQRIEVKLTEPNGQQELLAKNLIEIEMGGYKGPDYLMSGFTKVRDDEQNASFVIRYLLEASVIAPDMQIRVNDEGDYLKCPVIIQNGQMALDLARIKEDIKYWEERLIKARIEDHPFWKRLIESYRAYLKLAGEKLDNDFFINQEIEIK